MYLLKDNTLWAGDTRLLANMSDAVRADIDPHGIFLSITPSSSSPACNVALGNPSAARFAALHRYEPFWMRPAIVESVNDVPTETQVLFAQLPDLRAVL